MKNRDDIKYSYSSANIFPMKIFRNYDLINFILKHKMIIPYHLQFNPTNKCNFNCSFCSCSNRDRELEFDFRDLKILINLLIKYKCKSVTVTGGGEPTLYESFKNMVNIFNRSKIDIGLVTNGLRLNKFKSNIINKITWIRVSCSDYLEDQLMNIGLNLNEWMNNIIESSTVNVMVDYSFSYVLSEFPNIDMIIYLMNYLNSYNFKHLRIVSDILKSDKVYPIMVDLKDILFKSNVDLNKVIFQDRNDFCRGSEKCYISLLKPGIGADGYIYPCCGTQYALDNPSKDYEKTMRMGYYDELGELIDNQKFFDGSRCIKCYYDNYNQVLDILLNGLKHERFV